MTYSEEEISKYLNILNSYKEKKKLPIKKTCCKRRNIESFLGQHLCIECGRFQGHILGNYDINDSDRLHYQKKSVYHRKYYFEKKVAKISKIIGLNDEEKSQLYERLLELDCSSIELVNKKFSRKRMISINYIIKKILVEMGCKINFNLKNSPKILEIYDKWWSYYKELINGGVIIKN